MRRGVHSFVATVVLATLCAGVVAVTSGSTIRPQEQTVAAELDKLHPARPVAAYRRPTRFDMPGETTRTPSPALAKITGEVNRYFEAAKAAQLLAWYQGVAAALASQKATSQQPALATTSRRVAATQPASGGADFFACVRHHESRGDYGVINRGSGAAGAYQFMPTTWNNAARAFGRNDLVGVNPSAASPADQDAIAHYVYSTQGARPWTGSGCS
jgi:hypothetical protein